MHIGIVTPVYPPYRSGIGVVAAEERRRLRAAGDDVVVFTPDYHHGEQQEEGIVRLRPWFAWGNAAVVPSLVLRLRRVDVIHLHFPFYGSDILVAVASILWRKPLVVTFHMRPKASGWLGALFFLFRWLVEPLVMAVARTVIVSSEDYAETSHIRHRNRVVLPFGVDTARFAPGDGHAFAALHGLQPGVPTVLFVGGMDEAHYFKGVDHLLRACAKIQLPWQLLFVGDGTLRPVYEALAKQLVIADRVHFAGSVPFADLPDAYRAADIHVLPSIDRSEAFGLVTLEAMAAGLPSIVTDLPGVRTLVDRGVTGFVVPPADDDALVEKLTLVLRDPLLRKRLGIAARAQALAKFDQVKLTERLRALLRLYKA
ncbi:MAG: glycosyltransferase family 4 protein [Candidatus Uhrbacteria bacterium]|nr:glycosyltransferase family 4 protein [Candidatus Uhrbacteria bacterium]